MSDSEMRELDAWIAEHVFKSAVVEKSSPRRFSVRYNLDVFHPGVGCGGFKKEADAWDYLWHQIKHPTVDEKHAFHLLEKIAERGKSSEHNIIIYQPVGQECGLWAVGAEFGNPNDEIETVFADTLPLAICLFAKKLFA